MSSGHQNALLENGVSRFSLESAVSGVSWEIVTIVQLTTHNGLRSADVLAHTSRCAFSILLTNSKACLSAS
jgi:hypothetical protein